jgi:hypothetical protein
MIAKLSALYERNMMRKGVMQGRHTGKCSKSRDDSNKGE